MGGSLMIVNLKREAITAITAEEVAAIARRLEYDEYTNAFECLQDWHLLRAIAHDRPDLVEPYIFLLDMEAYDEA
jgi:hypothetical protein